MKFFNIDFHISVIADIRSLLGELGHRVDSLNLSNHNWVFGRRRDTVPSLDGMSKTAFGQEDCDRFHRAERERLTGYDGFIVTHTPCLSGLYEATDKPVVCVVSTRYDGFCHAPASRAWLESKLRVMHRKGQLLLLANNAYDAWHVERNVGIRPEIISSVCDYTGVKWQGGRTDPFLAGRVDVPGLRRLPKGHSWQDVADAACCVTIPYNASLMSVFERHSMGMPILMPSGGWTLLNRGSLADLVPSGTPDTAELEAAVTFSDWHGEALPGIRFFDGIEEIPAMLAEGIQPTTGQRDRKDRALDGWTRIAGCLSRNPGRARQRTSPATGSPVGKWKWRADHTGELHPGGVFTQMRDGNREHRFGTWMKTPEGFILELPGCWRKRIILSSADNGLWCLDGGTAPGGSIRRITTEPPSAYPGRGVLTCDSYAALACEHTAVLHTDSVMEWHRHLRPGHPYTLVTCHSDTLVDGRFLPILNDPLLMRWHAVNAMIRHSKLSPIPIGASHRLMLDSWLREGKTRLTPLLYDILLAEGAVLPKKKPFNVSFSKGTNRHQREACLRASGLENRQLEHAAFLVDLAQSRFCLAPEGNGVDTHRVWESLCCRTVPVISWNPMVDMGLYDGLPMVVLDRWEDIHTHDFTMETYERLMRDFDPACMTVERWIPRPRAGTLLG